MSESGLKQPSESAHARARAARDFDGARFAAEHLPFGVSVYDLEGRIVYLNPAAERVIGRTLADVRGLKVYEDLFVDAQGDASHRAFLEVAAGRGPRTLERYHPPFRQWLSSELTRVGDHVHVVARDVTDEVRQRRRAALLADISAVITDDRLDFRLTMQRVAAVIHQQLAADCCIGIVEPDGVTLRVFGAASADPEVVRLILQIPPRRGEHYVDQALRSGQPVLAPADELGALASRVADPALREAYTKYGPTSFLAAPLVVGDSTRGVLVVTRRGDAEPLNEEDVGLVADVGPQLGLYLGYADRRAAAVQLEHRLASLADALPALVAFVDLEQRYRYVNAGYEKWFGRPAAEFIGRTVREVMPDAEAWQTVGPHLGRALAGEAVQFRTHLNYPSAGVRSADALYTPVRGADGDVVGVAVLVLDVSAQLRVATLEREQHETERSSSRRLEALVSAAGRLARTNEAKAVAEVLVDEAVSIFSVHVSTVYAVSADGTELELLAQRGLTPEQQVQLARVPVSSGGPIGECVRTRQPVWVDSRDEYSQRFPDFRSRHSADAKRPVAFGVWPIFIDERLVGCYGYAFNGPQMREGDRHLFEVLASHGAEAMRRARLLVDLKDAGELREALVNSSPVPIGVSDEAGNIVLWNPAAERVFGWAADEVLGKPGPHTRGRDDEFRKLVERMTDGEAVAGLPVRRVRKGGELFDAELYASMIQLSDGRKRFIGMFVDVAQRQRLEVGRRLVADAVALLSRSLDIDSTLVDVVKLALTELADWCCVDLLRPEGMLKRVARGSGDAALATMPELLPHDPARGGISQAIATNRPVVIHDMDEATLRMLARDERHLAAMRELDLRSSLAVPLRLGDCVLGALSLASRTRNLDHTDLAIATELASHVASAIENARLYADAQKARAEAEAASRAKDEFLAMLGHELRNPLAPMVTALDLMRSRGRDQLVRERGVIERQVKHLSRLVDDLLDVSRITRGKVELRREPLHLAAVIAKAVEQTSPLFEERRHALVVDVPEEIVVFADATRLAQVFGNLLTNAAKYTPERGHVRVDGRREGHRIAVTVTDDGLGIDPFTLPRVFDSFVQAPQSRARTMGGLGLGLTIVKNLVELHEGSVSLHSDGPGKGTRATVLLPIADVLDHLPEAPAKALRTAHRARNVLVVDDNRDAAALLGEAIGSLGHSARTAFDGPSALKLVQEQWPDVAVLDIGLPVMDGYELADKLRALAAGRPLDLIAVTGYGQRSERERALGRGFRAHFAKPVDLDELLALISGSESR